MRDLSERDLSSLDCLQAEAVSLDIASKRISSNAFCILESDCLTILTTHQKKGGGGIRKKGLKERKGRKRKLKCIHLHM